MKPNCPHRKDGRCRECAQAEERAREAAFRRAAKRFLPRIRKPKGWAA